MKLSMQVRKVVYESELACGKRVYKSDLQVMKG